VAAKLKKYIEVDGNSSAMSDDSIWVEGMMKARVNYSIFEDFVIFDFFYYPECHLRIPIFR
jgi:hypothetical protein